MSNLLEKNIAALKKKYPDLAQYYEHYEPSGNNNKLIANVQIVADKKVLTVSNDSTTYCLDSLYDSESLLSMWFDAINADLALDSKYIMFGFGNGMFARKFLKSSEMNNTLIVYEPSDILFFETIKYFDVSDIIENDSSLIVVNNSTLTSEFLSTLTKTIKYTDVSTAHFGIYLNYNCLFEKEIEEFYADIEKALVHAQLGNEFMARRGKLVNQNIKNNLKYFAKSRKITDLRQSLSGVPAIIVSAGPSLNKNINDLAAAKGKSIIIAVDSAINTVKKNGIEPDLIVAVDPRKDERFLGEDKCLGIPFLTNVRVNAGIIREHNGTQFFDNTEDYYIQQFIDDCGIELPSLETAGSVATTAFSLAVYMGCCPIILIGQDLAYTNNETHAKESVDAIRTVEELEGNIWDTDIYGNPIKTSDDMLRYKEWFERSIEYNPDIVVYDATEGGALIKGSIVTTLKEVINKDCTKKYEVAEVFNNAAPLLDDIHTSRFIEMMNSMPNNLNEDKDILRKLLLNYEKLMEMVNLNKYHTSGFQTLSRKSNELLNKVENDPIMDYVMNNCYEQTNEITRNINHVKTDEKEELKSVIDISIRYANILKNAIEESEQDVIEMVNSLKTI